MKSKPKQLPPKPEAKPYLIPEVGMLVWKRRPDLQKAFPRPQDEKCAYRYSPNFLAWLKQYGTKEEVEIAAYFKDGSFKSSAWMKKPWGIDLEFPAGLLNAGDHEVLKQYSTGKDLCVEIGTFKGRSAFVMGLFAKKVVGIDNYSYTFSSGGLPTEPKERLILAQKAVSILPNIELRLGDSEGEVNSFADESIDLLFVDDGHGTQDVLRDFNVWYGKLKPQAVIVFHDYIGDNKTTQADVQLAIKIILESGKMIHREVRGCCFVGVKW